jgi:hypothetical protein
MLPAEIFRPTSKHVRRKPAALDRPDGEMTRA